MSTETQPQADKNTYKQTLNLPQTLFPMEAKLVQNEPNRLKEWEEGRLYEKIQTQRASSPKGKWVLHDGPPFANGDIHTGHVINKVLKDVFIRFRTMQGYQTPYVPGWDCHGLPIEHKIQELIKKEGRNIREMSTLEVRQRCSEYAAKFATVQCEQFKRLGILGEWNHPYLTLAPTYEAATLEVFAKFVEAGLVYRKLKPVPWSIANQTALADAELEYQDVQDKSVYVEFPIENLEVVRDLFQLKDKLPVSLMVWTTTPWTLPANLAIAVNPKLEYVVATLTPSSPSSAPQCHYLIAKDLWEKVLNARSGSYTISTTTPLPGIDLVEAELQYIHPFIKRTGKLVAAEYVTATDGTGLVHTAPGHGEDDYETGIREGLDVYSPVLANGRFDDTVPEWLRGKNVLKEGNDLIIQHLKDAGLLFAEKTITHSYPHDWRSKTPIIFRATEQWFVAMDKPLHGDGLTLRELALFVTDARMKAWSLVQARSGQSDRASEMLKSALGDPKATLTGAYLVDRSGTQEVVNFVPAWGRNRLQGMLESRPDWCVSRQRAWGLPIPVFYNEKGEALLTPQSVRAVAKSFEERGSDIWFTETPTELLSCDRTACPVHFGDVAKLRKEKDIFDVWFESGSSWHSVLQSRSYLKFPADLYLEGSDQHRGWFQLSLLLSLGATGQPPFKQVLTHGFIVKPDGTKVSKSDKEYVKAVDEINRHGADLLRLWCSSVDYQNDVPASPKVLQEFADKYRKIRNTLRYLLSNLYDFPGGLVASAASIPPNSLEGWILNELDTLIDEVTTAYDAYQLHRVFRLLHDFCSVQISSIYGNAMKDRLYCESPDSPPRRRSQTAMHQIVIVLTKLLAPILVFTADETWEHIPHKVAADADLASVHLALLPEPAKIAIPDSIHEEWSLLMQLRDSALLQLDTLKKQAGLNKALDAEVIYEISDNSLRQRLESYGPDLEDLIGAGHHSFAENPASQAPSVKVIDTRTQYKACARSWKRRPDVGQDADYPDLCLRDAAAMKKLVTK